ncbi:MAG: hypothetical protein JSW67_06730 [Candidatus Latescibacterota bacterium]|nr:MAG: hypothetical protein JSW67_06730 [Candidatus Latescibacterota bacterium]
MVLVLSLSTLSVEAQQFLCEPPRAPHKLELCSPLAMQLATRSVPDGLEISWNAPPREQTSYLSPLQAMVWQDANGDTLEQGATVPGIAITGTYLGVVDQRIEIAITQIGVDDTVGVLGVDPVRVAWSSIFQPRDDPNEILEFQLDGASVDAPLQFVIEGTGAADTTVVPGVRIIFSSGQLVRKGSSAVFDVEDFDGFHVWRWLSDPTQTPLVVGTYSKVRGFFDPETAPRPSDAWPNATPFSGTYTLLDRFVFDGNVYHYAITTFDQGFRPETGEPASAGPFDSLPWDPACECMPGAPSASDPGPTVLRVEYRRVSVKSMQWSKVKGLYRE